MWWAVEWLTEVVKDELDPCRETYSHRRVVQWAALGCGEQLGTKGGEVSDEFGICLCVTLDQSVNVLMKGGCVFHVVSLS
jgi:hypothetical protein